MLIRVYSLEYGKYLRGNKVVQKKFFFGERFFCQYVYFQNMAIRSCDYASQSVIKLQKVIV